MDEDPMTVLDDLVDAARAATGFDARREEYERCNSVHRMSLIGMSAAEIARRLGITERHVQRLRKAPPPPPLLKKLPSSKVTDKRAAELEQTAKLVLALADAMHDESPYVAWECLWRLPRIKLQELAMTALAMIPNTMTMSELTGWIEDLAVNDDGTLESRVTKGK